MPRRGQSLTSTPAGPENPFARSEESAMPIPGMPESYTPEFWQMLSAINPDLPSLLRGLAGADQPLPAPGGAPVGVAPGPVGGLPPGVGLPGPDPGIPPVSGGPVDFAPGPGGGMATLPFIPTPGSPFLPVNPMPNPGPPMAGIGPIDFARGPIGNEGAGKSRPKGGNPVNPGRTRDREGPMSLMRAIY